MVLRLRRKMSLFLKRTEVTYWIHASIKRIVIITRVSLKLKCEINFSIDITTAKTLRIINRNGKSNFEEFKAKWVKI